MTCERKDHGQLLLKNGSEQNSGCRRYPFDEMDDVGDNLGVPNVCSSPQFLRPGLLRCPTYVKHKLPNGWCSVGGWLVQCW
ncbi:unnamed protein product [Gongylonema pulchrum]|uniref:Thyroglobulin type-1 domain-containing protein n=1 Tax=Gongylonema pulchrum TaxID=637853 RepID=A0A183CW78_9BILA|nr:unnamed protein product [Gongylonema pulchrum]